MNLNDMFEGKDKPTALDKWRASADERLKKQDQDTAEYERKKGPDFEQEFAKWQKEVHGDKAVNEHGGGVNGIKHWQDAMEDQDVTEAKGLGQRVEIIRGPDTGKIGYVRQIKTDRLRSIKYLDLDLEDGGQSVVKSTDARIVKELDEANSSAQQAAIAINMKKHHQKPKHIDESLSDVKREIRQLMAPAYEEETGGRFGHTVSVKAPTMDALRGQYYDDLDAMFSKARPEELQQALRELRAMYGKTEGVTEGSQNFNKPEPYYVCINGKPWKRFETYAHARSAHNKLEQKFRNEGSDKRVSLQAADLNENTNRIDPILIKALNRMPDGLSTHSEVLDACYDAYAMELGMLKLKSDYGVTRAYIPQLMDLYKEKHGLTFKEDVANEGYSKMPQNINWLNKLASQWQDGDDKAMDQLNQLGWNIADDRRGVYIIRRADMSGRSKIYFPELTAESSMSSAEHRHTGPEFTGYWKGTDAGTPGNKMVGCEESKDTKEVDPKTGKVVKWSHEGDWEKTKNKDPRGQVTHMSDVARRQAEKTTKEDKAVTTRNFVAKNAKTAGAGQHKDKKRAEKQGDVKHKKQAIPMDMEEGIAGNMTVRSTPLNLRTPKVTAPKIPGGKHSNALKKATAKRVAENFMEWAISQEQYKDFIKDPAVYAQAKAEYKTIAEAKKKTLKNTNPCWKGYHPVGTKEKAGRTVPNCVPVSEETLNEMGAELQAHGGIGGILKDYGVPVMAFAAVAASVGIQRAVEALENNETKFAQLAQRAIKTVDKDIIHNIANKIHNISAKVMEEDWQKANKKDKTDGMSKKAVKAYRREHPGSKLQTAVTTKPSKLKKGSKASKRRKSYCSRSKGQMKMHNISCQKTPDKAICKARRRWNCESQEQFDSMLSEAIEKGTLKPGQYYIWTVYFDDDSKKRIKVTKDNFDPKAYYAKQNKNVINIDFDWTAHNG